MNHFDEALLSRIEDAGLNASAPAQQRWLDGWLMRLSPGSAKRARCINALAPGRLPIEERLLRAMDAYRAVGLPMLVRVTPFTHPDSLDADLDKMTWKRFDDTRVMVLETLPTDSPDLPSGMQWVPLEATAYAQTIGTLRGSSEAQRRAHAERMMQSPVAYRGFALVRTADNEVLACGQTAQEGEVAGLYDVFTATCARQQGLARLVCKRLLCLSAAAGARVAYLQTDADNTPARAVYHRLGFVDGYAYHYRQAPAA